MNKPKTRQRPRLTVAMIVRDEQDALAGTLASVRAIADEIVVLDTGSTDATAEVARQAGAKVVSSAWSDDFAAARNACWREAAGDWLLWLDAGERFDVDTGIGLRRFIEREAKPQKVYGLMVVLPATDAGGSNEQAAQVRLVPNRPDLRFVGRVRETVEPGLAALGMTAELAPSRIFRHAREHDLFRKQAKARRNLALAAAETAETGSTPPRLWLATGDAYADLGEGDRAAECYRQALATAARDSTPLLEAHYGLISLLDRNPAALAEQIEACLAALDAFPFDAQLLLATGNCMQRINRLEQAAKAFDVAVKHGRVNLAAWHLSDLPEVAAACLAATLQLQGQDDEARRILDEALENSDDSPRLLRQLLDLHIKAGRVHDALAVADRLPVSDDEIAALHEAVQGACEAVAGRWTQALGHLQIAYLEGCRHPLCLRWLAVTYLSNGQLAAAAPVLEAWRQVEPGNAELRAYSQALAEALSPPAAAGPAATAEADRRPKQIRLDTARSPAAPPVAPPAPSASPLHIGPYASPQTTQRA